MKKLIVVLAVLISSMNLFAGDMCELYAHHMKGDESLPVKIGQCSRILYEECELSMNKEKCIEKIHYSSNMDELFSLLSK